MNRYPKALLLFFLLLTAWAVMCARLSVSSGDDQAVYVLLGFPVLLFTAVWALRSLIRMRVQRQWPMVWLVGAVMVTGLVPWLAYDVTWRRLHPGHIRYEFSYGQTGSWGAVQFTFLENGVWLKGPWVGARHMEVRFPDLNGDGHADLQVIGRKRLAEYVYLPEGKGGCWWHLVNNKGFQVSYPPDGHSVLE